MAAGEGTRMRSSMPKVLHRGLRATDGRLADPRREGGRRGAGLRDRLARSRPLRPAFPNGTETVVQPEADGTGGAIRAALDVVRDVRDGRWSSPAITP